MPKTTEKITHHPATLTRFTAMPINQQNKRVWLDMLDVSTDHDDQFSSYAAQVDITPTISKVVTIGEFVEVYFDEGITGTSTKHRKASSAWSPTLWTERLT